ncbi:MAG TPA: amidase family protein, partial [Vicinamibacterales bacterium]
LGTDTGGSVRGPSTSNGIAGLKTTMGLVSRDGVIPLALSFDTVGPMARSVYDVAAVLGVIAGVDAADASTKSGDGRSVADYTQSLKPDALKGARIGVARDFLGQDGDVDWIMEASLEAMRKQGATIVDVRLPRWLLDAKGEYYNAIRYPEFVVQIADYLKTLGPQYPKNITELIERARQVNAPTTAGASPNPVRWSLMVREAASGTVNDYHYTSVRDHGLPLVRAILEGILETNNIDAIAYPTASRRPQRIDAPAEPPGGAAGSGSNLANLSGFPELIVPAGFSTEDLPIGISFLGPAFSEPRLLAIGYAFEQATKARRLPVHTPLRAGESVSLP